jgi:hypothetical protein
MKKINKEPKPDIVGAWQTILERNPKEKGQAISISNP